MREIPKEILCDVEKITDELIKYDNKDNLSWTSVFKEVLKNLNMNDKKEKDLLLTNVVTMITSLGYDIEPIPFKLKKY